MRFVKTTIVKATADQVWKVFAHDFDDAHLWMASVPTSYAKDNGKHFENAQSAGRVCELSADPNSVRASEQFLAYNEAQKTCTIRIDFENAKAVFPVDHNQVEFSIVDRADGTSEMIWAFESHIKPWAYLIWPLIRIAFGIFVGQIIEELVFYVENGSPHPRKLKAMAKLSTRAA